MSPDADPDRRAKHSPVGAAFLHHRHSLHPDRLHPEARYPGHMHHNLPATLPARPATASVQQDFAQALKRGAAALMHWSQEKCTPHRALPS